MGTTNSALRDEVTINDLQAEDSVWAESGDKGSYKENEAGQAGLNKFEDLTSHTKGKQILGELGKGDAIYIGTEKPSHITRPTNLQEALNKAMEKIIKEKLEDMIP